jgi:hypothetical protein
VVRRTDTSVCGKGRLPGPDERLPGLGERLPGLGEQLLEEPARTPSGREDAAREDTTTYRAPAPTPAGRDESLRPGPAQPGVHGRGVNALTPLMAGQGPPGREPECCGGMKSPLARVGALR